MSSRTSRRARAASIGASLSQMAAVLVTMTAAHLPRELVTLAMQQGGCFTIRQGAAVAVDARRLRRLADRSLLSRRAPQVYGLPGATSWQPDLWAAVLQVPGAVVSHESAGRMLGFSAMGDVVALTVPSGTHPRGSGGARVHQLGPVPDTQVTLIDGLSCTTVERTLCDLAAVFSRARLGFVLDDALAARRTTLAAVGSVGAERAARGRRGTALLSSLLDERIGRPVPRSELERRLDAVLVSAGLVGGRCEYPLPTDGGLRGFVDRAFPDVRLIVEADGRRWHTRSADFARDRARDRVAATGGWQTVRVTWEDLARDPVGVAADLRAIHSRRAAA